MSKPETMMIDDVKYVREDSIKPQEIVINLDNDSLANALKGAFVIVRSRNEGINAGIIEAADDTGIILKDCRRIYYHRPADKKLSWYEGVAVSGLDESSKVSGTVERKIIIEDYSVTCCSRVAKKSIMGFTPNAQS